MEESRIDPCGMYRAKDILGGGGRAPLFSVSKSTWWAGVKAGRFPAPRHLGRMTFWRGEDLLKLLGRLNEEGANE